jgi:hypothetical protein
MALITRLLAKAGLLKMADDASDSPAEQEESAALWVSVDDLDDSTIQQMEKEGLVHLPDDQIEELDTATPPVHTTRYVRLQDLIANAEDSALTHSPEAVDSSMDLGLNTSIDEVLAQSALQLKEAEWSIDRALHWIEENDYVNADPAVVAPAFRAALKTAGIADSRVLSDATLRDKALDKFEFGLKKNVDSFLAEKNAQKGKLSERIQALQVEQQRIERECEEMKAKLAQWRAEKAATEERWAKVIDLLIPGGGFALRGGITRKDES